MADSSFHTFTSFLAMCIICTDPIESLLGVIELNCSYCPDVVAIPAELTQLTSVTCVSCPRLASIPATLTRLLHLSCTNCPLVTFIPSTFTRLVRLSCHGCPLITTIPSQLVRLAHLSCSDCPRLVAIPATLDRITYLDCARCPLLVFIPPAKRAYCHGCPWLPQNAADYPTHIPSLLRLQRWFRTGEKQTFKRWIRTRAFNEWIFHPDQIGGKLVKRQMEAELGAMRPAKVQRLE